MKIFSGTTNQILTKRLIEFIKTNSDLECNDDLNSLTIEKFADGEILPKFETSIRNQDVYFVQSTTTSDSIMEILLVGDAAKRAGCKSFNLISPYMGYSRQDKTDHIRSSIGSKVLADILEKIGTNSLLTVDLHASSIQGFYNIPVVHLNGNKIFIDYLKDLDLKNLCIVAPDQGAVRKAADFCKAFPEANFAMINKRRIKPNEIHSMELVGDVRGKNVIIVDDIADTMGTMKKAATLITNNGALSVRGIISHGILSRNAIENIMTSDLLELIVSDTIENIYNKKCDKIKILSSSNLIGKTLIALNKYKSVHEVNYV
jgi:ribose-phosphate pyrophosphokinase